MEKGFQGKEGQQVPAMDDAFVQSVSDRYIELFEQITGDPFEKQDVPSGEVESRIKDALLRL